MSEQLGQLDPVGGGDPIPLLKKELQIGRRSHCDITLRFPNVSSHHCLLTFKNGYWFVEDTNSRNGIKVNDVRCQQKYLLPGDTLSIAKHEYTIEYEPQGMEPPPDDEEDVMSMSLMEKAGLVSRKRDRETGRPITPKPKPPKPPKVIETPDDEALVWLLDDPEEEEQEQDESTS
ncbi:MAG: FHA domain-containing protein [Planctomycetaceae bacterium]|nr:FHA domain-containing protein [Planctomycetaceae bacterium]